MNKHTPGPWEIDGDILLTTADPFEPVAFGRVNISHAFAEEERGANRILIAAAPDLLEALEELNRRMQDLRAFSAKEAELIIVKAIAKAKGLA